MLTLGDADKIEHERQRFEHLKAFVIGGQTDETTIDWYNDTYDNGVPTLFNNLAKWNKLDTSVQQQHLLDFFQEEGQSEAFFFIYFVRVSMSFAMTYFECLHTEQLATCAQLRARPEEYAVFVGDQLEYETYITSISQFDAEIDQIAFTALYHVLLEPASFGLDILQLNRHESSRPLDSSAFMPDNASYTILTLYRP